MWPRRVWPPGRMLPRDEPEPGGELSAVRELAGIADGGDQRRGGDRADALTLRGPLGQGAVTHMRFDLAFEGGDLHLELAHVLEQIGDAACRPRRQLLEQRASLVRGVL